ncbi:chemotaxis protein CheW [Chitinimonas sp.]|uniref:chemotaxis protein CheW n=1 Tax=Chitinimonas sp. TaxID=1934313 RepID=UPI0035B1097B
MDIDMSQFVQTFFDEANEHLAAMESQLLSINLEAPDPEALNAIFRAAHSIKGGAATFGFTDLTDVTHILENQLDRVRKGTLSLRTDMVDTFLEAGDALQTMLQAHQAGQEQNNDAAHAICQKLHALEQENDDAAADSSQETSSSPGNHWRLSLKKKVNAQQRETLKRGLTGLGWIDDEGSGEHYQTVSPDSGEQIREAIGFVLDEDAYTLEMLVAPEPYGLFAQPENGIAEEGDGFGLFAPSTANDGVIEEGEGFGLFEPLTPTRQPAIAEEGPGYGLFAPADAHGVVEEGDGYGLFAPTAPDVQGKTASSAAAGAAPAASKASKPAAVPAAAGNSESNSIRVGVEKVDELINLVGELVITQAMLSQITGQLDPALHERLHAGIALLERNTRELQESAMSIRMMPISFVFSRFPRVVRDTASKLGKKVRLVTHGESTELDRGLIEKLADPLTHLVRNSLDHGIEKSEARLAKGKDEQGTLTLKAFHQGGNIIIQVSDDGAGLNRERILAKARSQGMKVSDAMPDNEIWPLIFEPGFSTAETVTDVSGRGVGMDVVRRNIQGMGGRIDIDTVKDAGTTMTIRLPLTLAILEGMAIRVAREVYVIPLAFIVESLQPNSKDIRSVSGKGRVVSVRGDYLPIITLHEVFEGDATLEDFSNGLFVILESEAGKTALYVDDLLGQHQVVIKSLEANFRKVAGISGATIMGDGHVALIIDVESLVRMSLSKQRQDNTQ